MTLTEDEHQELIELTKKGTASAQKIRHAQILLKLDESFNEKPWTVKAIIEAYHTNHNTVCSIARRFLEEWCIPKAGAEFVAAVNTVKSREANDELSV